MGEPCDPLYADEALSRSIGTSSNLNQCFYFVSSKTPTLKLVSFFDYGSINKSFLELESKKFSMDVFYCDQNKKLMVCSKQFVVELSPAEGCETFFLFNENTVWAKNRKVVSKIGGKSAGKLDK